MNMPAAIELPRTRRLRAAVTPTQLTFALMLVALTVRLIGLGARPLWLDEGYSVAAITRSWHGLWTIVPTYETHPPFYYSLLKLWSAVAGTGAAELRALSVAISVLTIPLVIAAALELEREDPTGRPIVRAGMAALLAAFSPLLIFLDQQARPYALLVFAYSVAILGLLRLLREFRSGDAGSPTSWTLLVAGTELTLWSHSLGILYGLCLALALAPSWLARPFRPARIRRGVAAAAVIALLYSPCGLIIASEAGDWGAGWIAWHPFNLLTLPLLYSIPVESLTLVSAVSALLMLLLAKRAIHHDALQRGWNGSRALLLLWWGPPLLAVAISVLATPVFLPRTLSATVIPAYLAFAGALARTRQPRERQLLAGALALTLLPTAIQTALQPASEKWDEVATALRQSVKAGDQVWIYPNDSVLPLKLAAPGASYSVRELPDTFPATGFRGINRSGSPGTPSLTPQQAERIATDPRLDRIGTIWLVTRQMDLFDPDSDLARALGRVRVAGRKQRWGYIAVQPWYSKAPVGGAGHSIRSQD